MILGTSKPKRQPWEIPGFGDGTPMGGAQMAQPNPMDTYQRIDAISGPSEAPAQKRKPNWGGVFTDFLAGVAGKEGPYLASLRAEQERAEKAREYQRQRMDKREDYVWQQQNRNNDTEADFAFWKRNLTPEQFEIWKANKINPPVWRQDYATGQWMRVDPSAGAIPKVIGPALDDDWELEGDGASNGTGGFPRR